MSFMPGFAFRWAYVPPSPRKFELFHKLRHNSSSPCIFLASCSILQSVGCRPTAGHHQLAAFQWSPDAQVRGQAHLYPLRLVPSCICKHYPYYMTGISVPRYASGWTSAPPSPASLTSPSTRRATPRRSSPSCRWGTPRSTSPTPRSALPRCSTCNLTVRTPYPLGLLRNLV